MASLISPGVAVTVIDESFYTPAEPGTTPLIVVATAENKMNAAGTATAAGTLAANAGKAFKITSQKDLIDTFGVPFFEKTATNNPIHGGERNEYGLLAAYSLLGVTNAVFIVRAGIDLDQLQPQTSAPGAEATDGQWWVDTSGTQWGIQEWNAAPSTIVGGQSFSAQKPIVLTNDDSTKINPGNGAPNAGVGSDGSYAVVFQTGSAAVEMAKVWYKRPSSHPSGSAWVLVGSEGWTASHPTVYSSTKIATTIAAGQQYRINGNTITLSGATRSALLASLQAGFTPLNVDQGIYGYVSPSEKLYVYFSGKNDQDSTINDALELANVASDDWIKLGIAAGTYLAPKLQQTPHTQVPEWKSDDTGKTRPTGSVWIKTTSPNLGANVSVKKWSTVTKVWTPILAPLYSSTHAADFALDRAGGGVNIPADSLFVQTNAAEYTGLNTVPGSATFRFWRRATKGASSVTSAAKTTGFTGATVKNFTISESVAGLNTLNTVTIATAALLAGAGNISGDMDKIAAAINSAAYNEISGLGLNHVTAAVNDDMSLTLTHTAGGEIRITDTDGIFGAIYGAASNVYTGTGTANMYDAPAGANYTYLVSGWRPLASENFVSAASAPLSEPQDGQLWYNPTVGEVDLMIHNGTRWKGYKQVYTGTNGPIISATAPTKQPDGVTNVVENDLWISTAVVENYPQVYRRTNSKWVLVDSADQTTESGILFADARWGLSGATGNVMASIKDLSSVDYVDFDAPDPALYPKGMLLWNTRRSGGNVKQYHNSYLSSTGQNLRMSGEQQADYAQGKTDAEKAKLYDRWVTASPNNEDGSGSFLRHAQRSIVVSKLKSVVDTSSEIRDEERRNFNIIAAPGYPELMSNLVNLNIDRGLTAFVVGDTPLRLEADATSLITWGSNQNLVTDNGDNGIVTYDNYLAVFYPNGFTTDLGGYNAVVPASHMMLKTITLSDNVSYPWFAPAGTRRGNITNATAVGYIDAVSGEFQTVALNNGQRDTLYDLKINPIAFFNGVGLVNYGQKTRDPNASALDRINVARLVVYLRSQLNKLARPYIFEPNDKITRDEIKQSVESLLLELVGLRALYDFAVVCDDSNNTASRIDRNELWVDIAISPVKAVEFIYIPLRVKNTGEI
jgi:hypothetical protein